MSVASSGLSMRVGRIYFRESEANRLLASLNPRLQYRVVRATKRGRLGWQVQKNSSSED